MSRRKIFLAYIGAAVLFVVGFVAGITSAPSHAQAQSSPLVYICAQLPCVNAQELEIFDGNKAPICSVGEYGGLSCFGDNIKVFPPGTVYHPAVIQSWESPAAYDRTFRLPVSCVAPAVWLEPGGIWVCSAGRRWVLRLRL